MPVKRSRVGSSSACLETSVATSSPVKVVKTAAAAAERPTSMFLTVASPVNDGECGRTKIGEFLERCHYCSKRIGQDSDVFMYSNLCAFCSIECRDCKINLDQLATKRPEDQPKKLYEGAELKLNSDRI